MSGEMDLSTNLVEIYVALLKEGTTVFRPTKGKLLGPNKVEILPTVNYDPEDEEWEFTPGSIVECISEKREGREVLIARRQVSS